MEEMDIIIFYTELSLLIWLIPKHYVLIIGGDMNTHINKDRNKNSAYTTP